MTIEKLISGKATVDCRFNAVRHRWTCNIHVGRKHLGSQHVRAPADEADEAARLALARAVKRGHVAADDLQHDDGAIVVQHDGAKGKASMKAKPAPRAAKSERTPKKVARKAKVVKVEPSSKAIEKAHKIVGNGEETRALEKEYVAQKKRYHQIGDALKNRHEAVAAVAGEQ